MKVSVVLFSAVLMALTACSSAPVEALRVGQKVEFALLQDQFSNPFPHEDAMGLLIYADSMEASRDVRDAIHLLDSVCYETGKLVFVADVSGMPSLITKLIAVPKMRGYGFPVWLDYDGEATEAMPVKEDQVSVLTVEDGLIREIQFVKGKASIMNILIPLCGYAKEQVALM